MLKCWNFFTTNMICFTNTFAAALERDFVWVLVRFDTKSPGRQISALSRPERSVQSASTGQIPAHDYTTLSTVSHLSIWRHRQQGPICKADSFMWSFRMGFKIMRNHLILSTQKCTISRWPGKIGKIGNWVCTLTRSSLCHLNGSDSQGPDITLQN